MPMCFLGVGVDSLQGRGHGDQRSVLSRALQKGVFSVQSLT